MCMDVVIMIIKEKMNVVVDVVSDGIPLLGGVCVNSSLFNLCEYI